MPKPNPSPPDPLSPAARAAVAVYHIAEGSRDDFDALLAHFLHVCWPTVSNQAQ